MKMKYVLAFFTAVIVNFTGFSQDVLETVFDTEYGIKCDRILEDNNGNYILCCSEGYEDTNYNEHIWGRIIKLTQNFDITSKLVVEEDTDLYFTDMVITDANKYLAIGGYGYDTGNFYKCRNVIVSCFDENLETMNQTILPLPEGYRNPRINICKGPNDKIYAAGYVYFLGYNHFFLLKMDSDGNILQTNFPQYPDSAYTNRVFGILDYNYSTNTFVAFGAQFEYTSAIQAIEIDTNLNFTITGFDDLANDYFLSPYGIAKWLNDSIYLFLSADIPNNVSTNKRDLFITKMNKYYEFVDNPIWFGRKDTADIPGYYSMDFFEQDKVFVASHTHTSLTVQIENKYLIGLIDSELNIKGKKWIGSENVNYFFWTLCATSDGGCIFVSETYDYLNNPSYDKDLHILKLYPEDIITSAAETPLTIDSDYNIFPNPGKDELYIQTANKGVIIQLFNEQGIEVLSEQIDDNYTSCINTSNLSSGVYFYKFTDKRGFSESGKWIKK